MPKEILLTALTAEFEGGIIEEWHKDVGDRIEVGDIIAEVSTDKAVVEFEATDAGTLGKILVPAGDEVVAADTPIAILLLDGETADDLKGFEPATRASAGATATAQPTTSGAGPVRAVATQAETERDGRLFASPVALRIANQLGIDVSSIEGSGPDGRIVLGDVEAAAALLGDQEPARAAGSRAAPEPLIETAPDTYTEIPNDMVRKAIAKRLGEAKREIPHFYLTVDCELDALLSARTDYNAAAAEGQSLSVNDFIIKACALALKDVPAANSSWTENAILQFNDVNVAIAVATPNGLITPVIRQADLKDLAAISSEVKQLAARAKERRLKPEEYKGGGFTISNLGMYGIRDFAAIINPPQSCVLAVGAGEQRPVAKDGAVGVATVMTCTLSVDHRAVDGAVGAEFLRALKKYIEQPQRMTGPAAQ
ncbi:MAG: pyruvate dehydrogenase complex dihydrolipoamide acetyltransferase [Woeseia sp.]